MIQVRSACKINLTLDVLGRRPDGYHKIDSLVHTVALWDEITVIPGQSGFDSNVELPAENLCTRAASAWLRVQPDAAFQTVRVVLKKNLPVGAGIGAGSANAAAVLLALNQWQRRVGREPLSPTQLVPLATSLGADVPLFLDGGAQRMQGIGDRLTSLPAAPFWIVLLKPPVFGDTRAIFSIWSQTQTTSFRSTQRLIESWENLDIHGVAAGLGNDLAEPARCSGQPVDETLELLRRAGALGAGLSGSGTACFGLFQNETAARAAELQLTTEVPADWFCATAALCPHGVQFDT